MLLKDLLTKLDENEPPRTELQTLVDTTEWDGGLQAPLTLSRNKLLQVTLADVSGGSETPSMARKVLAWKKQETIHWDDLKQINTEIADLLQQLMTVQVDDRQHLATCRTKDDYTATPTCLLYTSPSPRDQRGSRMPSSA